MYNKSDIERLLEIHTLVGGSGRGRKHRVEVVNSSAIVLITAFWEAYCEDLCEESVRVIIDNADDPDLVPKELRKSIAKEIDDDHDKLACWNLAGEGWRDVMMHRVSSPAFARSLKFNTPKWGNIDALIHGIVGLKEVSRSWKWRGMKNATARSKLNDYVELRGEIAHRGSGTQQVLKRQVEDYFGHIERLVELTDKAAEAHLVECVGSGFE